MKLSRQLLGQVFLNDKNYIEKIVASIDIKDKNILEIGPGKGALTEQLVGVSRFLYCVEFDKRFCAYLENRFSETKKIKIINKSILDFDIASLGKKNLIIVGNIPYQISSSIIKYLTANRKFINQAYLTVQKEFADKLIAQPRDSHYCFLSCLIQYYADAKKLFHIPKGAFLPTPKVDSAFVVLSFYNQLPSAVNEEFLFAILKRAFGQPRKQLTNSLDLTKYRDKNKIFEAVKLSLNARPQDVSLPQYILLSNLLNGKYEKA